MHKQSIYKLCSISPKHSKHLLSSIGLFEGLTQSIDISTLLTCSVEKYTSRYQVGLFLHQKHEEQQIPHTLHVLWIGNTQPYTDDYCANISGPS